MTTQPHPDPMTPPFVDFERSHEDACAEEGHLIHTDDTGTFCLRCPYVEPAEPTD